MYRHTQIGWVTLIAMLATGAVALSVARSSRVGALVMGVVVALVGIIFSTLTIEIRDGMLRSWFGPGVWRKTWPVADIAEATVTRSSVGEGWGIRFTGRGMLYNVSGLDAVEVTLRSGVRFRLGTDEPERLAGAIREGIR